MRPRGVVQPLSRRRVSCKGPGLLPELLRSRFRLCTERSSPGSGDGGSSAGRAPGQHPQAGGWREGSHRAPQLGCQLRSPRLRSEGSHTPRVGPGPARCTAARAKGRVGGQRRADPSAWRRCSRLGCHRPAVPALVTCCHGPSTAASLGTPTVPPLFPTAACGRSSGTGCAVPSAGARRAASRRPGPQTWLLPKPSRKAMTLSIALVKAVHRREAQLCFEAAQPRGVPGRGGSSGRGGDTGPQLPRAASAQSSFASRSCRTGLRLLLRQRGGQQAVTCGFSKGS